MHAIPGVLRRHWLIAALVLLATALRIATLIAYRPALGLFGDSVSYLRNAQSLRPVPFHPLGYPLELRLFTWTGTLVSVVVVQHLLGVLLGVGTYALLLRLGVRRTLAAVAAVPILLDAYQVDIEQFIMPEAFFDAMLLGALALLLVRGGRWRAAACAGALVGAASVTRGVGAPLIVLAVLWLLVSRAGWRPIVAFAGVAVIPLVAYMSWYDSTNGKFAMTGYGPRFLWAKVAPIADCPGDRMPHRLQWLCLSEPVGARPTTNFLEWNPASPYFVHHAPQDRKSADAQLFARIVMLHQPVAYARLVGRDFVYYFRPTRTSERIDWHVQTWRFLDPLQPRRLHSGLLPSSPKTARNPSSPELPVTQKAHAPAHALNTYQRFGFVPGPLVALCALLGLAGFLLWQGDPSNAPRRWGPVFLSLVGLSLLVLPAATVPLDFRYLLPAMIVIVPAGMMSLDALLDRLQRRPASPAPGAAPDSDGDPAGHRLSMS